MASIEISQSNPVGYQLFSDGESYLNEVSEQELDITVLAVWTPVLTTIFLTTVAR